MNDALFDWRREFVARGPEVSSCRAVGIALSLWCNDGESCDASGDGVRQAELAAATCYSEKCVRDALKQLDEEGWIERRRTRDGYVYTLTIPEAQPHLSSGSNRTSVPVPTAPKVRSQPHLSSGSNHTSGAVPPIIERSEKHTCLPAEARELLAAKFTGARRLGPDRIDELLDVVAKTGAPWDYVEWLVDDVAERNEFALGPGVARMVAGDLRAQKWRDDPGWARHQRELEIERQRQERQGEIDEWWAEQAAVEEEREALWSTTTLPRRRAWRKYFERARADILPREDRDATIREWTLDALLEHGSEADPPPDPPRQPKPVRDAVHVDVGANLAAFQAAIHGDDEQ